MSKGYYKYNDDCVCDEIKSDISKFIYHNKEDTFHKKNIEDTIKSLTSEIELYKLEINNLIKKKGINHENYLQNLKNNNNFKCKISELKLQTHELKLKLNSEIKLINENINNNNQLLTKYNLKIKELELENKSLSDTIVNINEEISKEKSKSIKDKSKGDCISSEINTKLNFINDLKNRIIELESFENKLKEKLKIKNIENSDILNRLNEAELELKVIANKKNDMILNCNYVNNNIEKLKSKLNLKNKTIDEGYYINNTKNESVNNSIVMLNSKKERLLELENINYMLKEKRDNIKKEINNLLSSKYSLMKEYDNYKIANQKNKQINIEMNSHYNIISNNEHMIIDILKKNKTKIDLLKEETERNLHFNIGNNYNSNYIGMHKSYYENSDNNELKYKKSVNFIN